MEKNQEIFIEKLDRFIRKYYQNQLFRGVFLSLILVVTFFVVVSFSEYFLYLSVTIRTIIAAFSVGLLAFIAINFFILPVVRLLRIGKRISYRQAIAIISKYFPDLEDRLLNTLELTELVNSSDYESDSLLVASINQRIESIRFVPFRSAISFKENLKFLKYLFFVTIVFLALYILIPDLYKSSTDRLVHFRENYSPPADFKFILDQEQPTVVKGADFLLKVHTEGKYIPDEVHVVYGQHKFLMKQEGLNLFSFLFRNVNSDIEFSLISGKVESSLYQLKVLSKPGIKSFYLEVFPPPYTRLPKRKEENLGDVNVPVGSLLKWNIIGDNTKEIQLVFRDSSLNPKSDGEDNVFLFSRSIYEKDRYRIYLSNVEFENRLFADYNVDVIADLYPQIQVSSIRDSVIPIGFYFKGIIKDDYGFSQLRFCYEINGKSPVYIPVSFHKETNPQEFYFAFDFSSMEPLEGSQIRYYFEIFDNDAINHPKRSSSEQFTLIVPDSNQIYDLNSAIQDSISKQLEMGINLSQNIRKDILRLQKGLLEGTEDKWQQQQIFQEINSKKKELDQLLQKICDDNFQKNSLMNAATPRDSLLMNKQKQIEKLLKNVMSEELQKLFEEFNRLADNLKAEEINKKGNHLKMSFEDFQKQMDRNLRLLERYEVEVRMNQIINRIEKLADNQDSSNREDEIESLKHQQSKDSLNWQEIQEDLADVVNKNLKIADPYDIQNLGQEEEEISNSMNQTGRLLEEGKTGKAIKNMKQTSIQQRKMAEKLSGSLSQSISAQLSVDIDNLIRLMNNLLEFSFQQEDVMGKFKSTDYRNPLFVSVLEEQGELKEEYKLIQDSLLSLSAHSPQVAALIGNRIFDISSYLEKVLEESSNRQTFQAAVSQQKVLTEVNELALFLSESLKQLMEQMANAMPGDQIGDQKGGKPSFAGMKSEQQSLMKMLEDLIQEIKSGKINSNSKEKLGKLLQKQEMFQERVGEMLQKSEVNYETQKILREIKKMVDQTESDVLNFSINSNTIFRQKQILSRLLDAENAQMEQDTDKKRVSNSGNILKLSNPKEIFEYKSVRTDNKEIFEDSNVILFDYYNKLYLDYMIKIGND